MEPKELNGLPIKSLILFKLDRTIAIVGIVAIGLWALKISSVESINVSLAALSGLVGYVGGRAAKG